jgi:ABC-2 type transport system ATP-binding protein
MAQSPVLELSGLVKSFRTPKRLVRAVRSVDLCIRAGEIVALLGPNGAGKSTTIDMALGLVEPDAGTVRVLGRPPRAATEAGAVGVMLQTGSLIRDLTVREVVTMVASLYRVPLDVDEVLHLVGIEPIAGRRTQKLSGGETQRVRFALALVCNPQLLVLDEPTVAMDVEIRHAFWTTMREFAARGKAVLFATHHLAEADAHADRAVLMAEGRVVADGPTNEIKAMTGLRTIRATGISAPLYFMVGLAALGTMNAVVGTGARIATERFLGWTRQLRLTPLSPRGYFGTKVAAAYSSALLTIAVLYAAGISLGVNLSAGRWTPSCSPSSRSAS